MRRLIRPLNALRAYLRGSIGTQVQTAFGLTVLVALLVALLSLSAIREATHRLESIEDSQRRMISAIKELELGAELQSNGLQAFLLSGDERYLEDQARGQDRFAVAFATLDELTMSDEGYARLDTIEDDRRRFEGSAASQLALYRQGWRRSAIELWQTDGQESKQSLESQIHGYRAWFESTMLADVDSARERGQRTLVLALSLIGAAAAAGLAVGVRLTRSITIRLGKLAAAAQALARDEFSTRARVAGRDEVAALAGSMNVMAEHLEASRLALEDSRQQLRESLEQQHRRAEQLQEVVLIGREIARLATLDVLLPDVVTKLHQVFGYERVVIFLLDPTTGVATLRASAGQFTAPVPPLVSLEEGQGIVGWVAGHSEALRVGDVRGEPRYVSLAAAADTRSELTVPIRAAGEVLGVLDVESSQIDRFDASDEATLVILGDQIGTAIQNARLFDQQHNLAVAEERNRLAREIHDTLAQGLTAITLQLEVADAMLDTGPELARPKIQRALELTRGNLEEARRSVMDLRAAPLQDQTLPAALEGLAGAFRRDHGLRADFAVRDVAGRLPSAVEAGLYRIAQEALNNVANHAQATLVHLTLERDGDWLMLTIGDDGKGLDADAGATDRRKGGFGLTGMQERAKLLGGKLVIDSAPAGGTRIVVTVPAPVRRDDRMAAAGAQRT